MRTLAAHISLTQIRESCGCLKASRPATLLVDCNCLVQSIHRTTYDTFHTASIVKVKAALSWFRREPWKLSVNDQTTKAARAASVGNYQVMQTETPQPCQDRDAFVRPAANKFHGIEIVRGWLGGGTDSPLRKCLRHRGSDSPNKGVRLHVRQRPFARDLITTLRVCVYDVWGKWHKERHHRPSTGQKIMW